jgi:hypothetical protein
LHRSDDGCRGVGGTIHAPCTSVGEENLLGETLIEGGDPHFKHESILVHEFSHAVMNIGLSEGEREEVGRAYEAALASGDFDRGSYMMANPEEFWCVNTTHTHTHARANTSNHKQTNYANGDAD